jgi:hypothetical protein
MDRLGEYTPSGVGTVGRGHLAAVAFIPTPPGKRYGIQIDQEPLHDAEIQGVLETAIQAGTIPAYDGNRAYFVIVAPYIPIEWKDPKGQTFIVGDGPVRGYHDAFRLGPAVVPYAVIPHPGRSPVLRYYGPPDAFEQLTIMTSHEMVEMILDPTSEPFWGLYDKVSGQEIADICIEDETGSHPKWGLFHGYWVSTFWSEKERKCVVSPEDGLGRRRRMATIAGKAGRDECDTGAAEGQIAEYVVALSPGSPTAPASHEWRVAGATIVGPSVDPTLRIQLPAAGSLVAISVEVTDDDGCRYAASYDFTSLSQSQAEFRELLCRLRRLAHYNWFVNPLWDPLRDLNTTPVSGRDIKEMQDGARRFLQLTDRLSELHASLHRR